MTSQFTATQDQIEAISEKLPAGYWLWCYLGINPSLLNHLIFEGKVEFQAMQNINRFCSATGEHTFQSYALWQKIQQWQMHSELETYLKPCKDDEEEKANLLRFVDNTHRRFSLHLRQIKQVCLAQLQSYSGSLQHDPTCGSTILMSRLDELFSRLDSIAKRSLDNFCHAIPTAKPEEGIDEVWTKVNETPFGLLFSDARMWQLIASIKHEFYHLTSGQWFQDSFNDMWKNLQAQWLQTLFSQTHDGM